MGMLQLHPQGSTGESFGDDLRARSPHPSDARQLSHSLLQLGLPDPLAADEVGQHTDDCPPVLRLKAKTYAHILGKSGLRDLEEGPRRHAGPRLRAFPG